MADVVIDQEVLEVMLTPPGGEVWIDQELIEVMLTRPTMDATVIGAGVWVAQEMLEVMLSQPATTDVLIGEEVLEVMLRADNPPAPLGGAAAVTRGWVTVG